MTLTASCSGSIPTIPLGHNESNSVYYWKTVFLLDSTDLAFLHRHNIRRVYLRMFDVSEDPSTNDTKDKAVPNASVRVDYSEYYMLKKELSQLEFVPVVYITLPALKAMKDHEDILASNIVTRVMNMASYNALPNVCELQLDCDWTSSTEKSFFTLCDSVKSHIARLNLPWHLSSTIRLHQLSRKAPPVDNGVLMVYNTGNFSDPHATNSIIDPSDVKPYLKHLAAYPIHLDVAYPTYSWQLLFRRHQFLGLTSNLPLADTTLFTRKAENIYIARRDIPHNNRLILAGDMVRSENSAYTNLSAVKSMIESHLTSRSHSNILYHLDSANLSKYTPHEIAHLFSTTR